MTPTTYTFDAYLLPRVESAFADLAKRARKLGLTAPTFTEVERREVAVRDDHDCIVGYKTVIDITVEGPAVVVDGWRLVAVLQHEDGANVVRRADGGDAGEFPEGYRVVEGRCDHCNTVRRRNDTFVLQHEDGRFCQVGRDCLRDFIGVAPEAALFAALVLPEVAGWFDGDGDGFGEGSATHAEAWRFLTLVAALVRTVGWFSKAAAERAFPPMMSTAQEAWFYLFPPKGRRDQKAPEIVDRDREVARAAVGWILDESTPKRTEFLWNLSVMARKERFSHRDIGLAAALVSAYLRHVEGLVRRETMNARAAAAGHFAKPGDKFGGRASKKEREAGVERLDPVEVEVMLVRAFNTHFGVSNLVKMVTAEGHLLTWFTSGTAHWVRDEGLERRIEAGDVVLLHGGTVKAHKVYQGTPETEITRGKLDLVRPYDHGERGEREVRDDEGPIGQVELDEIAAEEAEREAFNLRAA